ncbi:MAG: hypothetical protein ACREMO_02830 [Gemmatimonadales bacterium]
MPEPLLIATAAFALLGLLFLWAGAAAVRKGRWLGSLGRGGTAIVFLTLAALAFTISVSTRGYRALTHEQWAATVTTVPTGPQAFHARVRFPDDREAEYDLAGDEILFDAHILKWHSLGTLLGLSTGYELDRIAGRYTRLEDEESRPRTVFSLKEKKPVDMFFLVRRFTLLALLVDAEYGSATYIATGRAAQFEVSVSPTGLVIRRSGGVD